MRCDSYSLTRTPSIFFAFGVYKLDTIWYNLKKTRKVAPICYSIHRVRFSFLPGNTGCALPKAKPVLPVLYSPRWGLFILARQLARRKEKPADMMFFMQVLKTQNDRNHRCSRCSRSRTRLFAPSMKLPILRPLLHTGRRGELPSRNFPLGFYHSPLAPFKQSASGQLRCFSHVNNPFNLNLKLAYSLAHRRAKSNNFFSFFW